MKNKQMQSISKSPSEGVIKDEAYKAGLKSLFSYTAD